METKILDILLPHLTQWGYSIIVLMTFLETSAFLGLLVPGESVVVIAGLLASKGILALGDVILAATCGAIMGDTVGYFIGHRFGEGFFLTYGHYFFFKREYLDEAKGFFEKHGGKTVFMGRFMAWLRSFAPVVAGISKMRYSKFLLFNAAGGTAWATIFSLLGFFIGNSWGIIKVYLGRVGIFAFISGVVIIYFTFFTKKRRLIQERVGWIDRKLSSQMPMTWGFMKGRFMSGRWYGLNLTIALLSLILALFSFSEIVEDLIGKQALFHLNFNIRCLLEGMIGPEVTRSMADIPDFGGTYLILTTIVLTFLYLVHKRDWWGLFTLFLLVGIGEILLLLLKVFFQRAANQLAMAHGYSFPGGHAFAAAVVFGFLIYITWKLSKSQALRFILSFISILLIILIGISRIYLDKHGFTDVLGGYTSGFAWLVLSIAIVNTMKQMIGTKA
jgi:membrane protein DedA with SNARE-associated domain/membrane-associated phospholipid phosphatase